MNQQILVTDKSFILPHHEQQLRSAGYDVVRISVSDATEQEVCEAIKGKVGYIVGGFEMVTDAVIESADELRAIMFVGTNWRWAIPGHELAGNKGIAIGAAAHINSHAVAEFGIAMSLIMCRNAIGLARGGTTTGTTERSLSDMRIGIAGLGHIGEKYAKFANALGAKQISYYSRTRKPELEQNLDLRYVEKHDLVTNSDLLFVSLPSVLGKDYFTAREIQELPRGSIIVSSSSPDLFNIDSLYERLAKGEITAAFDDNIKDDRFQSLPLETWYSPTGAAADNTHSTIEAVSDCCVKSIINLIETGSDERRVN